MITEKQDNMNLINILLLCAGVVQAIDKDYYELLGILRTADNKEIRKAFKKLAVTLHPDKNPDNPEAHETFIKITRAYEVLKDDEKRKHYDVHGEDKDSKSFKQKYHSYTYYRDQFGIYDDDPEIITLSHADFASNVEESDLEWFINFYSPLCSHCHDLAPTWRKLSKALRGVIMFGAVNCEDDWSLCRRLGVASYPSLMFYPANKRTSDLHDNFYRGRREYSDLFDYVLHSKETSIIYVTSVETWQIKRELSPHWLLILHDDSSIPKEASMLYSMLRGLVEVGVLDCGAEGLCSELKDSGRFIYLKKVGSTWDSIAIDKKDPHQIMEEVLDLLPGLTQLDQESFTDIVERMELGSDEPWLIYFYLGSITNQDLEIKKLPALLPNFKTGSLHCGRSAAICSDLGISRYPVFGVIKQLGGIELHHGVGSDTAHLVAQWARDSAQAVNLVSLAPNHFDEIVFTSGDAWLIEFFSPYCPPCIKMLTQLRRAASEIQRDSVKVATVDCTAHRNLCLRFQINQYPTTVLFNGSRTPQKYRGAHSANALVEYIYDLLHPTVISLNKEIFYSKVGSKQNHELWMVDFFVPWCGPCQQLAPEYRKLAKMVSELADVYIGEVNCEEEKELCSDQGVQSYPHIRLYPTGSRGLSTVAVYSSWSRDAGSLRRWLFNFVKSSIIELDENNFSQVLHSSMPWLIDFYAPWCGHCLTFEPEFILIAQKLEGRVKSGKVNCDKSRRLCSQAGIGGYPSIMFYRPQTDSYRGGIEIHSQMSSVILSHVDQLISNIHTRDEL